MLIGCAGGWCQSREMCAHYLEGQATQDIRLCAGTEEPEIVKAVTPIVRVVKKEEREDGGNA